MKIHIVLTKADADIICLKKSLPRGKFNEFVIKVLRHAAKGGLASVPMEFEIDGTVSELHTKIDLPEDLVKSCYEKLGFEKNKFTTGVKAEIRKCINKNRKVPTAERIPLTRIRNIVDENFLRIRNKEQQLEKHTHKNTLLFSSYERMIQNILSDLKSAKRERR